MKKLFYVYWLKDDTGKVFYVGKGTGKRMYEHMYVANTNYTKRSNRSPKLYNKVRKFLKEGRSITPEAIFFSYNEKECFDKEVSVIEQIGLDNLCNIDKGGLWCPERKNKNASLPDETKRKMSIAQKGKIFSEKHRRNISKSLTGRKFSQAHRDNISNSKAGKSPSAEHRKNLSISLNNGIPFLSYEESREWMRTNHPEVKTKAAFFECTKNKEFYRGVPKSPFTKYRGNGWVSWIDFLGK